MFSFNLIPRVFSLSNMAAAGEKTLAHSELKRSLIGAFHYAFILLLLLYYFAKPVQHHAKDPYIKVDHNTRVYDPYSLRTVCGFFNVPQY